MASQESEVDYLGEGDYLQYMSDSDASQEDVEMEDTSQGASPQTTQVLNFSGAQSAFSIYKGGSAQSEEKVSFSDEEVAQVDKDIFEKTRAEFNEKVIPQFKRLCSEQAPVTMICVTDNHQLEYMVNVLK